MGYDSECVVDLDNYPGEYFCPVCRTLVFPNEAFQAYCTHLYCKACLEYMSNSGGVCPFDGHLVTESDSKPIVDSNKALAETISKIKVYCRFHRSGCTWHGYITEGASHCSGCSFGNSPVVCNKCQIQIPHRQVVEHAKNCPAADKTTAGVNQIVAQPAGPPSQAQNAPVVNAPVPVQNPNLQVNNVHSQVAPVSAPTPEQWYHQQYQQYYQQYMGYDPYQQQYYSYQQYQQPQSHVYPQPQQPPPPSQQPLPPQQQQPVPQAPQAHGQAQSQPPQAPPQVQGPPQGQAQAHAPNYQVPQQQTQPPTRPQTQVPLQTPPPPPHSQPLPFAQAMGMRPVQNPQVPQYQQPHVQMHHPQMQSQMQLQPPHTQSSNQLQPQPQPQPHHYYAQPQPHILPSQPNYSTAPAVLPQPPPGPPASGHHSYQQPQPPQKMHLQQHPVQPQQPGLIRPPLQQSSTPLQPQHQVPGIPSSQPQQQIPPHAQQTTHPIQPRAVFHPFQQAAPQHYAQQQQFTASFPNQLHQQGQLPYQQPMQSQMLPSGPAQPPPSQNYDGRASMPNQGIQPQNHSFSTGAFDPAQLASTQTPINQNYMKTSVPEQNAAVQETRSPSKGPVEKGTVLNDTDNTAKEGLKSVIKQEGDVKAPPEQHEISEEAGHSLADSDSLRKPDRENQMTQSHTAASASSAEGHILPPQSHDFYQQRPQAQVQGQPPSNVGTEGRGSFPHGKSTNPAEGRGPGYFGPPQQSFEPQSGPQGRAPPPQFEGQYGPPHVGRPNEASMSKDRMPGSVDGCGPMKNNSNEPNFLRVNGGSAPDSMFGSRDEKMKSLSREHLNPIPGEPTHTFNQGSLDRAPRGPMLPHHPSGGHSHGDGFGPGPEFGQHHMKHFTRRSPDREYSSPRGFGGPSSLSRNTSTFDDSREAHRFGEGSRSSNLSSDSFRDGRFPSFSGHPPRGDNGGMGNPRFSEHDAFGPDGPGHPMRGNSGPGYFHTDENAGSGAFSGHGRVGESGVPGSYPHFGEPPMRNNYSLPGFPNSGNYAAGMDAFDHSRKRSTGWCRICGVDCETVEGLDMHSQTREHQQMAMEMVKNIKLHNRKKQRTSGRMAHEGGNRTRKGGRGSRT
ncbi:hypothetical protein ABFX02_14G077600 [Erythranthe guttata]